MEATWDNLWEYWHKLPRDCVLRSSGVESRTDVVFGQHRFVPIRGMPVDK
jgi:hypothetical protein